MIDLKTIFTQRQEKSKLEYGTELKTNNGRNPLIDALQEKLDTCMYLRQAIQDHIDGVKWVYNENFWVEKEPKPISNNDSKSVLYYVLTDLVTGTLYLNIFNFVPKWLLVLYANEIETTKILLSHIIHLKGKSNALRN